ncbi:LUD domain-containing protein [Haloplanus halobius]|uniref:LUD domain-containing protein n=1 Tax=Haloplanus halobius TaxID=2934938 RepID=UPI002010425E|nr:LUD domain-containing protein [Haloplanus sp. XH21]
MATTNTNPTLSTFEDSLAELGVDCTRVTVDDFAETLDGLVREPAVGVSLPFDVSYPDNVTVDPTPAALERAATGVTPASFGVANYGSVLLPSTADGAEPVSLYPELHVPVVRASDVLPDLPEAMDRFGDAARDHGESAIVATGPSATADMGELVLGAHGPEAVHVVMLDE